MVQVKDHSLLVRKGTVEGGGEEGNAHGMIAEYKAIYMSAQKR